MAQKLIRDIPDDVMSAIEAKAGAESMNPEAWIRKQLVLLASEPIIKERYAYRVYGKAGKGIIKRLSDHPNGIGGGCSDFSEEEFKAYQRAQDLMRRNGPGDREKAVAMLQSAFEDVMEVSV